MTFTDLGLSKPLLQAVRNSGYTKPTPIQAQAIPAILKGVDIMAAAQTGTGKTAGFTLPLLQRLGSQPPAKGQPPRALVLTPTRELAAQVQDSVLTYGKFLKLRSAAVFGGVSINRQINELSRGVDVLVATPGRLLDLYQQDAVCFDAIEILILDEADRMLDMGFIHDIKKIMALLPQGRQNLMFSATFSKEVRQLAKGIINNPVEIDVAPRNSSAKAVTQILHPVDKARKAGLLSHLIRTDRWDQVLVFSRTKRGADKLVKQLSADDIKAVSIHGNKSQAQRMRALAGFKKNKFQVLVATDIAARGIDIDQLSQVVNFDLPNVPEDYVHRIGRTGRAGASGHAISLVSADEIKLLKDIERLLKRSIKRVVIDEFWPEHALPESAISKPSKPSKRSKSTRNKSRSQKQAEAVDSKKRRPNKKQTRSKPAKSNAKNTNKRKFTKKNKQAVPALVQAL